ncbi:type II secretion system minor pseudopilin GspH [Veronia pacifica]|uniref:Type II secretion system protein H n=1 Tax=Veronia pacifica TaxID=1080227 RepID=A0A1C3EJN9_9GAMM|nr:type II secretion system minor pseudopilin GspH [Veronia pacifica]ODA33461.1 type II secretion system protein GspH [Veronia pacifica]
MYYRRQTGFTLLEIMLVLVVLALSAAVILPNIPTNKNDAVKEESQRFFRLVQLWSEQAMLSTDTFGVRVDNNNRYHLMQLTSDDWVKVTKGRYSKDIELPEGVTIELEVGGFTDQEDRLFDRDSLFDDTLFADEEEKEKVEPPQIILMGNGEIIPFKLTFYTDDTPLWLVEGNELASFKLEQLDKDTE